MADVPTSAARTVVSVATAAMLPVAFGVALITLRETLSQRISLLMVLPVLVVALLGGPSGRPVGTERRRRRTRPLHHAMRPHRDSSRPADSARRGP